MNCAENARFFDGLKVISFCTSLVCRVNAAEMGCMSSACYLLVHPLLIGTGGSLDCWQVMAYKRPKIFRLPVENLLQFAQGQ